MRGHGVPGRVVQLLKPGRVSQPLPQNSQPLPQPSPLPPSGGLQSLTITCWSCLEGKGRQILGEPRAQALARGEVSVQEAWRQQAQGLMCTGPARVRELLLTTKHVTTWEVCCVRADINVH